MAMTRTEFAALCKKFDAEFRASLIAEGTRLTEWDPPFMGMTGEEWREAAIRVAKGELKP